MSLASDLVSAFAETELTAPVLLVRTGAGTRAFYDSSVIVQTEIGLELSSSEGASLHVIRGALGAVRVDDQIQLGVVGAAAVAPSDPLVAVRAPATSNDDGAFDHLIIVPVT